MAGKISHDLDFLSAQEQIEHERDYADWNAGLDADDIDPSGGYEPDPSDYPDVDDDFDRIERLRELELDAQDHDEYFNF
jgi:hypothetical protein